MKRDMDLIRRMALAVTDLEFGASLTKLDDVSPEEFGIHAIWMKEAGLVDAEVVEMFDNSPPAVFINRLTWDGCEFADAVRNDTLWRKAKDTVIKPSASFTFGLLRDWLKQEIAQGLPSLR